MGTDPATGAAGGVHHWTKLFQANCLFRIGTFVVTGATENSPKPRMTTKLIDNGQPHSGLFLPDAPKTSGGTDFNAFHTEPAGYLFRLNQGGTGMDAMANIEHDYGVVGANLHTSTAANATSGENLLLHSTRWTQAVGGNRRGKDALCPRPSGD